MSETEHEQDAAETQEPVSVETQVDAADESDEVAEGAETGAGEPAEAAQANTTSPEEWEARFKRIGKSHKTYVAAVGRILEEDATDLLPCPLCEDGIPAFVNAHDAGKVDAETVGKVNAFLGFTPPETLRKSRVNEECGTCAGLGELLTGSRVEKFARKACPDCNGMGFTGPGNGIGVAQVVTANATQPNGEQTAGVDLSAAFAAMEQSQ